MAADDSEAERALMERSMAQAAELPQWLARHNKAKALGATAAASTTSLDRTRPNRGARPKKSASASALLANSDERFRVDHRNTPYRWREPRDLEEEAVTRERRRLLAAPNALKPFPYERRKNKAQRMREELEERRRKILADGGDPEKVMPTITIVDERKEATAKAAAERAALQAEARRKVDAEFSGAAEDAEAAAADEDYDLLSDAMYLKLDSSQLPLSIFDNSEHETKTNEEWLAATTKALSPFYVGGAWKWRPCTVQHYAPDTQEFTIRFRGTDKEKVVKRIALRFHGEPAEVFDRRVAAATEAREAAKALLRFDHYVSQQPTREVRPMAQAIMDGITAKLARAVPAADASPAYARLMQALTSSVLHGYSHAMKKAILFFKVADEAERRKYEQLRLPPLPAAEAPPRFGKIGIPAHPYARSREGVSGAHFSLVPSISGPLCFVHAVWEDLIVGNAFVDTKLKAGALKLPCELRAFAKVQKAHAKEFKETLATEWRRSISEMLTDHVQDTFDFFVTDSAAYFASALCRLLKSIELRMNAQLRQLVNWSTNEWVAWLRTFRSEGDLAFIEAQSAVLGVSSSSSSSSAAASAEEGEGEGEGEAPAEGEGEAKEEPKEPSYRDQIPSSIGAPAHSPGQGVDGHVPLFRVSLIVDDGQVKVKPSQSEMEQVLVGVLDQMVAATQTFSCLDTDLVSLLHLPARVLFNIGRQDDLCAETDALINDARQSIRDMLTEYIAAPNALAARYGCYVGLLAIDTDQFVAALRAANPSLEEHVATTRQLWNLAREIRVTSYDQQIFGAMQVDCTGIKQVLSDKATELCHALLEVIVVDACAANQEITQRYQAILARIGEKPKNEAELAALKRFMEETKTTVVQIQDQVAEIHRRIGTLDEFCYPLPQEDHELAWSTMEWPRRVDEAADNCEMALETDKIRMMDKLALEKEQFELDLERFENEVRAIKAFSDLALTEKNVEEVNNLQDSLMEAKAKAEDFNAREEVFGFPPTEYSILTQVQESLEPYYKLWNMVSDFDHSKAMWLTGPFLELDAASIESDVTDWWKTSYRLSKTLADEAPGAAEVALVLRERTTEFRECLPIIQSLASPALRDRHWDTLGERIGQVIEPDEELTLQALLDMDVANHIETIQEVCVVAEKEYSLERALQQMMAEWEPIEFEVVPYKETGTHLVRGTDDITALLDDHIVKVQTMRGSPYIKPIERECRKWEKKLQYAQQLVDEWLACQRTWLYLEPIFGSEDIMRQMPTEARRFATVDGLWRKTMADAEQEPNFMEACTRDKLLEKFVSANEKLDQIHKGLNDYLELKRLYFPRFFFLSNDELLEILSQTKEPRAVQPHLGKCFEAIARVKFEDDLKITQMISAQGETVDLNGFVDPESAANKGNVEMWLVELERMMWDSMKDVTMRSVAEYPTRKRTEWMLDWPAQVILGVSQVFWTQDVAAHIERGGSRALRELAKALSDSLQEIVMRVRGQLSKLQRTTLGALVVIDVHARDVVQHMADTGVETPNNFEWISQMRYYWEQETLLTRIVNATVNYGYEYLGNTSRLVITPLTDRCYRTMMGAVDLLYGGAPEGPAGTGKTETVKDLSKAVAIQCVVFNCSDGLDYLAMAKFFKGLAGCGSWCCFDEFNRINIEVLSVIAQQILTINRAKRAKADKFTFEGTFMQLNRNCNVFITMNPGYAGRAELPDNLKALFRPCAMMVPNYALIAEIRLYSFGFQDARNNARKLVRVLGLSSEQLSSQKHYDYGMRAVNSILVAAGNLRQKLGGNEFWTEEKIVLRSINDVNLPKFTSDDLPLFRGITSDLFPGISLPAPDHGALVPAIDEVCVAGVQLAPGVVKKLQPKPEFTAKVVQLYETVAVRHGLMVVGQTHAGKTCVVHALRQAISLCAERGEQGFVNVQVHTMNPKSITSGQLYGNFDENTHEWSDGVLACIYRDCSKDTSPDLKWVMFDGPVDAVWIENMNTVLDDNKKLCLMSGEIVKMSDTMTMMFEAEDLEEASPATVSRVGMVFMEPLQLGWRVLLQSWLDTELPEPFTEPADRETLTQLAEWLLPPMLFFVDKSCVVPTPVTRLELVSSLLRLLRCVLTNNDGFAADHAKVLECLFIFALVWSVGACVDPAGRVLFDEYLRALLADRVHESEAHRAFLAKNRDYVVEARRALVPPPEDKGIVYNFKVDPKTCKWQHWMDLAQRFAIPREATFNSILVPTIDTERHSWLLHQLVTHGYHVMATGDTGTGKSVSIKQKLLNGMPDEYTQMFLNFSARTSANQTQDIIDGKLDKRRKGVFGPPLGLKCVIFVDDLNMPAKEEYGAQPPIELLRQWMDHRGWYDRKENTLRQLIDIQFITAMGPPGGGRSRITQRYVRHFNVINFVPFDDASLNRVFSTIMDWWLAPFNSSIKQLSGSIVNATVSIYNTIADTLRPTPAKSHYTFNLRDVSKVFQGVLQGTADTIREKEQLIRLWAHESLRVFHDRLVSAADRTWFHGAINTIVKETFNMDFERSVRGNNELLVYGNFIDPRAAPDARVYDEVADHDQLQAVMAEYLEDYNATATARMSLVLFMNAIEHVTRISRVINQPFGNALLVGVGGSGRKSLTTLAVFMADYRLFQIEISKAYGMFEWREDLKTVLNLAGAENKPTVFLFSDTQIVTEQFVEDINGILNTGEVPNLFNQEEYMQLLDVVGPQALAAGCNANNPTEVYNFFVDRCRANLHVVLCLSPIGDAFRTRLRMFPSLVNCCTIDWFSEWPEDALRSVADHFLNDVELTAETKAGVVDVCVDMQERVSSMSAQYLAELRRHYYVTPTSYLELISTFKNLLATQRLQVMQLKQRYQNGLTKLVETADQVVTMQSELEALQPKLKQATLDTDALLASIATQTAAANEKKKVVAAEEAICNKQAAEAKGIKDECEAELAEAIPALEASVKALQTLTKGDIVEVKAMKKPPDAVKLTMEAVCIMMGVSPVKIKDPNGGTRKVEDYWGPAQKQLLSDSHFLQNLLDYDKDNIPQEIMTKVQPYGQNDKFRPEIVKKGSVAAAGLCKWVHAMIVYDRVAKVVAPKKEKLKGAVAELNEAQAALAGKQAELKEVEDNLANLQEQLQAANERKEDLQRQVQECANRLARAEQLIGGLGGERVRWSQLSQELQETYDNVVGDIMLSAGVIAYLGAFTGPYRAMAVSQWSELLAAKGIPCSGAFSLADTLGEPVKIREWTIAKLPNDAFSIDNAIMLFRSNRWPLMIDPQGQANQWVKQMHAENLKVVKQTQQNFVRSIEMAINFGAPVLLENVAETLDPVLEPLLLKQVVTQGGVSTIRLGDNTVEYDERFALFITTKLPNPHYPPELCVKVNLLNFMATQEGLQDQMLGITVAREEAALEAQREQLILEDAENKRQLKEIEDKILHLLQSAEGNILDDEVLIDTLAASKVTSNLIEEKVKEAAKTQEIIAKTREGYQPVAFRAAQLFFCIAELSNVDPMYQYSLDWFINLFLTSIDRAEPGSDLDERLGNLNETFTYLLYNNVCRSLFEKDKLLFSFLLTSRVLIGEERLAQVDLAFFLQGNTSLELERPNPVADASGGTAATAWLTDEMWGDILAMCKLPAFRNFERGFVKHLDAWEHAHGSPEPMDAITALLGDDEYSLFHRMMVVRALRPDAVVPCVQQFVAEEMGQRFIEPPPFNLRAGYEDSNCATPLIFVLTPGADPMTELTKLAEEEGFVGRRLVSISLGQGQGPLAAMAIEEAIDGGTWVCLQNCHLSVSWMPTLEKICEEISPERAQASFRLWLTSEPSKAFPAYILQNGVKMTNEPPKGMRANLAGSFSSIDDAFIEGSARPAEFKKLLFGLCFFHATVRERCKFGPLGWNIQYVFSDPDLRISMDQLKIFLDDLSPADPIPYAALAYLAGECNYGGRVTDDKDRRCLLNILSDFYTEDILMEGYTFSPSGTYFAPPEGSLVSYRKYIKSLPINEGPEVFGLHDNANISCALAETKSLLGTALSLQPRSASAAGKSWDETLDELARDIEARLPPQFDIERAELDFPVTYSESMNTVLTQELKRFNKLTAVVRQTLVDVQRALKGLVVMSAELEELGNSMVKGAVPRLWAAVAYPSLKPLGSWVTDLLQRLTFLQTWMDDGVAPNCFWISGFFFTQAFITGSLQNYARKHQIPIDELGFDMAVLSHEESEEAERQKPDDGAYIKGLFLEGAGLDPYMYVLCESRPKELYVPMPAIHLIPRKRDDIEPITPIGAAHVYECPVYKTSMRQGTLSTTGHSTNFVMYIRLPMSMDAVQKHWVKRGVAMLTQLSS